MQPQTAKIARSIAFLKKIGDIIPVCFEILRKITK